MTYLPGIARSSTPQTHLFPARHTTACAADTTSLPTDPPGRCPRSRHRRRSDRDANLAKKRARTHATAQRVLDGGTAQVDRVLTSGFARSFAQQIKPRHFRLIVVVEIRHHHRRRLCSFAEHHQRARRADDGALFALNAVIEAQHLRFVVFSSSTAVGQTKTQASQPVQRSSLMA